MAANSNQPESQAVVSNPHFLLHPTLKRFVTVVLAIIFAVQLVISAFKLKDGLPSTTISHRSISQVQLPGFLFCDSVTDPRVFEAMRGHKNLTLEEEVLPLIEQHLAHPLVKEVKLVEDVYLNQEHLETNLANRDHFSTDPRFGDLSYDETWRLAFHSWTDDSPLQLCQIMKLKYAIQPSPYNVIQFSLNVSTDKQVYIKLHDLNQMATAIDTYLGAATITVAPSDNDDNYRFYEVSQTWIENLDQGDHSCDQDNDATFFSCVVEFTTRELGCLPPWDPPSDQDSSAFADFRACDTPEDNVRLKSIIANDLSRSDIAAVKTMTGCVSNCRYPQYEIRPFTEIKADSDTLDVVFKFTQTSIPQQKEEISYDSSSFIADAGGYLGLLLGLSLFDLYEFVVKTVQRGIGYLGGGAGYGIK